MFVQALSLYCIVELQNWQPDRPNYGCSLSVGILCELRSAAEMAARHWLAFDIECAICAALADEVWRANGASDRGMAMRLQGQRTAGSK